MTTTWFPRLLGMRVLPPAMHWAAARGTATAHSRALSGLPGLRCATSISLGDLRTLTERVAGFRRRSIWPTVETVHGSLWVDDPGPRPDALIVCVASRA